VLKTGGIYLVVSYGYPQARILHLVAFANQAKRTPQLRNRVSRAQEYQVQQNGRRGQRDCIAILPQEHFCYICVKKNDAERLCAQNWERVKEEILKEQSEDLDEEEGNEEGEEFWDEEVEEDSK